MAWGTVTVGPVQLRETTDADVDGPTVRIHGQETSLPVAPTAAQIDAAKHNVLGLIDSTVPVTFTDKSELNGFYVVTSASEKLINKQGGAFETVDWALSLELIGTERDVEVESRVPTIARATTVASPPAAVFWHAPSPAATSYWTGATVPTVVTRSSADGALPVYLGIPAGVAPRWTVPVASYLLGSARLLFDGIRRVGEFTPTLAAWQVDNGLVQVTPGSSGAFTVACWDSGAWLSPKSYQVTVNGSALTTTPEFTVLRNTPEEVGVRLSYPTLPGRVTVDLSVRRGARFVTGVLKRHSSATLGVIRTAAEAATAQTGGLKATSADADGNRFVMGSAASVTTALTTAAISKAAVLSFDFFLGHEVDVAPQAGDAFADLWAQYRGSSGELARVVVR